MSESEETERDANDPFEEDAAPHAMRDTDRLRIDIEGFEGPIDVLLTLARDQKVDLTRISILALADRVAGISEGAS